MGDLQAESLWNDVSLSFRSKLDSCMYKRSMKHVSFPRGTHLCRPPPKWRPLHNDYHVYTYVLSQYTLVILNRTIARHSRMTIFKHFLRPPNIHTVRRSASVFKF